MAQIARFAKTDLIGARGMSRYDIREQCLRLVEEFLEIDEAESREVIITITKFAANRARNKRLEAAEGRVRKPMTLPRRFDA